ncbi:pyridoxamine 5'-phosphate oxidase family protein [Williamsia sp.]|uniref:pyridoxamine 5'-phosphate oxidase family protein n=1 Tax=Williamsia sp. TaxID=1872085 RepID=UPI002F924EB3
MDALNRKKERQGDRALLNQILDEVHVATVSTVVDGLPWSVPMLIARHGDAILMHGSTGAGALRHIAAGAPVAVSAFIVDGLVVADTLFDHSMNYRSAVVRGTVENSDVDPREALNVVGDSILPGRRSEVRPHSGKEIAATIVLSLPIVDGQWITKRRTGGPGGDTSDVWTGHIPMRTVYDEPITETEGHIPESVRRLSS